MSRARKKSATEAIQDLLLDAERLDFVERHKVAAHLDRDANTWWATITGGNDSHHGYVEGVASFRAAIDGLRDKIAEQKRRIEEQRRWDKRFGRT